MTLTRATVENGENLDGESYTAVLKRDVEQYVAIALDLSGTRASDQALLVPLMVDLKRMAQSLEPAAGGPPVSIAIIVFGRSAFHFRFFTSSSRAGRDCHHRVRGYHLNGAINWGVDALSSRWTPPATLGAVVAMGTLVTITDGRDNAGVRLENRWVPQPDFISSNIDDEELTRIGPQGSFLAPEQTDWAQAFDRVGA